LPNRILDNGPYKSSGECTGERGRARDREKREIAKEGRVVK